MDTKYEKARLLDEDSNFSQESLQPQPRSEPLRKYGRVLLGLLLTFSMTLNLLQGVVTLGLFKSPRVSHQETKYAGLIEGELQHLWTHDNPFTSENATERHHHWDSINIDRGLIALPSKLAGEMGIPIGSTFPWNHNKSLYLINAYHGIHCLKNIYQAFMEYQEDRPQSIAGEHIIHCLDQIRLDIICTADDTPRTTTPDMRPVTGEGQIRTCRNFDALTKWADQYPSCYRYGNPQVENKKASQLTRMRFCPEGTEELNNVRTFFGKGDDWKPSEERKWSWFDDM